VPEELSRQIFTDGFTTKPDDRRHRGIGLALVRLVNRAGGTIEASTVPRRPLSRSSFQPGPEAASRSPHDHRDDRRDDYHVATIHAAYVRKLRGFSVAGHAASAPGARAELRRLAPILVLLDLYLPDGHGIDLVRETLASKAPRPDFLVITAARDMASVRAAMQLGTVHYLVKPFSFGQLEERMNAYRYLRGRLAHTGEAEQHDVDALYGLLRGPAPLAKGQPGPTMASIRQLVHATTDDLSASEIAEAVGISRSTAQRYLAELAKQGRIELHLHYGSTGPPRTSLPDRHARRVTQLLPPNPLSRA
jgi:response regulator of citrate/malate metabolism